MKNANTSGRKRYVDCDTGGTYATKQDSLFSRSVQWAEDFGCASAEVRQIGGGEIHGYRVKDGEAADSEATEAIEGRLFENIGEDFYLREQTDSMETENKTGCLERFTASEETISSTGHTRVALYAENVRKIFNA